MCKITRYCAHIKTTTDRGREEKKNGLRCPGQHFGFTLKTRCERRGFKMMSSPSIHSTILRSSDLLIFFFFLTRPFLLRSQLSLRRAARRRLSQGSGLIHLLPSFSGVSQKERKHTSFCTPPPPYSSSRSSQTTHTPLCFPFYHRYLTFQNAAENSISTGIWIGRRKKEETHRETDA
ncbi:hypothetical protein ATANTOWER_004513 [Ataeniobius toweri]|uniref:Uncharacterized protein n=1 Tax=Ataeniobius toweri TaxID=208326 RepID=A0ABU7C5U0_9TELE|nr:hypothetical protein [Ataeniobius toweri]